MSTTGSLLATLAALYSKNGDPNKALSLLEYEFDLSIVDYDNAESFESAMKRISVQGREQDFEACITSLVTAIRLSPDRRDQDAICLLEKLLQIDARTSNEAYSSGDRLKNAETRKGYISEKVRIAHQVIILADLLRLEVDRGPYEASSLLLGYFGFARKSIVDDATIVAIIDGKIAIYGGDVVTVAMLVVVLSKSFLLIGGIENARNASRLLIAVLPALRSYTAASQQDNLDSSILSECELTYASALGYSGDPRAGIRHLNDCLGIQDLESEEGDEQIRDAIQQQLQSGSHHDRELLCECVVTLCDLSMSYGMLRRQYRTALIESLIGVCVDDCYDGDSVRLHVDFAKIKDVLGGPDTQVRVLSMFVNEVYAKGYPSGARAILEAYFQCTLSAFLKTHSVSISLHNVILIAELWIASLSEAPHMAFDQAEAVMSFLRQVDVNRLRTFEHRLVFLRAARRLWPHVVRIAVFSAESAPTSDVAEQIERELMVWSEQLNNRLLAERSLLRYSVVDQEGDCPLGQWNSGARPLNPHKERRLSDGLVSPGRLTAFHNLQRVETAIETVVTEFELRELRDSLLNRNVNLLELVPDKSLWLRVMIDSAGALRWWAWRRDQSQLRCVERGDVIPAASGRLYVANARFNLEVERCWNRHIRPKVAYRSLKELEGLVRTGQATDPVSIWSKLDKISMCAPHMANHGKLLIRLWLNGQQDIAKWYFEDWQTGLESLDKGETTSSFQLNEELEAATCKHVKALQDVLNLDKLEKKLPLHDLQELNLIYHVDGELLGMPLDWLRLHNQPIWQGTVKSSCIVPSLTLRHVLEKRASTVAGSRSLESSKNILAVFWEEPSKRKAGYGVYHLETLLFQQNDSKWEIYGIGDSPLARQAALIRALEMKKFSVVVACGHGVSGSAGIQLAEGTRWFGQGNLEHADLVVLAACSVGRLEQGAQTDVEGMCAELASNGGRCVVAAKWPVEQDQTADFAAAIVRRYQETADSLDTDYAVTPFIRAQAFYNARYELLANHGNKVSQHVAAAFSIYGWG